MICADSHPGGFLGCIKGFEKAVFDKFLCQARARIRNLRQEIKQYYGDYLVTSDLLELRNIADVAELIIRSAEQRRESRGLHYMADHPETADYLSDTIINDKPGGPLT